MPIIDLSFDVLGPPERAFDLSRSIDFHLESTPGTGERAVDGTITGLIGLGETVTWEARHLLVRQRLTTRITAFDRPHHFRDEQIRGVFRRMVHDHDFRATERGTTILERFEFEAPLGPLGRFAEVAFLTAYMRRFLTTRGRCIAEALESGAWRDFLCVDGPSGTPRHRATYT